MNHLSYKIVKSILGDNDLKRLDIFIFIIIENAGRITAEDILKKLNMKQIGMNSVYLSLGRLYKEGVIVSKKKGWSLS